MSVIFERMPSGIPGDVSRKAGAAIEPALTANQAIPYGSPVQLDAAGKVIAPTDAGKPIYGFLVRPYPVQASGEAGNNPGAGASAPRSVVDVLRSGHMTVRLSAAESATPVKGAPVKVVFAASGGFAVGDIAASQGTAVTGCAFMGGVDASGNAEIAFNI